MAKENSKGKDYVELNAEACNGSSFSTLLNISLSIQSWRVSDRSGCVLAWIPALFSHSNAITTLLASGYKLDCA
jgi:hypothetical protein